MFIMIMMAAVCLFTLVAARNRKIIVDVGANCGDSYKKLLREHPQHSNDSNTEIHLIEANPLLMKHLTKIAAEDHRVRVYPYAVSANSTGTSATFTIYYGKSMERFDDQDISQMSCNDNSLTTGSLSDGIYRHGGKLYKVSENGESNLRKRKSRKVTVKAVNLRDWLRTLELDKSDNVILKIDVEGTEFALLEQIMSDTDLFCLIGTWHVEFHMKTRLALLSSDNEEAVRTSFFSKVRSCGTIFGEWD